VKRLVIIGGGITGLSAAWEASRLAPDLGITLIEQDEKVGGKIRTDLVDGFILEAGPDSFLTTRPEVLRLCEDMGIAAGLIPRTPRKTSSFIMHNHLLSPLPQGFSGMVPMDTAALAASPLLSEAGKRRALEMPDLQERTGGGDESIASFMIRRFGEEAYQLLIEPLVGGIHAADASLLSRDAVLPPARGAAKPDAGTPGAAGTPPFLSFPRGTAELIHALEARLTGVTVVRGTRVESVRRRAPAAPARAGGFLVEVSGGGLHEADALIVTTPAHEAARLLARMDPALQEMLSLIPFGSTVVIHLAYRKADVPHPLDGYGYLIPGVEQSDVVACTWSSQKWEGRAPSGHVLLRLMAGRFGRRDVLSRPDEELFELARGELSATLGITAAPVLRRLHRWDKGMPQYTVGHHRRVETINARALAFPGLILAGSSYGGVGIPQCVESGMQAATAALRHIDGHIDRQKEE